MKVIVNGIATEYKDEGTGPIILILHGWKASLHTFDALTQFLTPSFRVLRLDLPGFGESEMPRTSWAIGDYATFVKSFLEKLDLRIDILVGHSMGGRIAIKGVANNIFHPEKVVLMASAGVARRRGIRNTFFLVTTKLGKLVTILPPFRKFGEKLRQRFYEKIGSDYFDAGALKDIYLNIIREDLSMLAGKISVPTLLIWGSEDLTTPLEDGRKLEKLIKGSKLEIIPSAGHLVPRENAEEVAALIKKFSL